MLAWRMHYGRSRVSRSVPFWQFLPEFILLGRYSWNLYPQEGNFSSHPMAITQFLLCFFSDAGRKVFHRDNSVGRRSFGFLGFSSSVLQSSFLLVCCSSAGIGRGVAPTVAARSDAEMFPQIMAPFLQNERFCCFVFLLTVFCPLTEHRLRNLSLHSMIIWSFLKFPQSDYTILQKINNTMWIFFVFNSE